MALLVRKLFHSLAFLLILSNQLSIHASSSNACLLIETNMLKQGRMHQNHIQKQHNDT